MTDVAQGLGWPKLEDGGAGATQTAPLGWPQHTSDFDASSALWETVRLESQDTHPIEEVALPTDLASPQDETIGQPADAADVSRETMEPPLPPVLTAAQIAARGLEDPMDADTPIAVAARAGGRSRRQPR